MTIGITEPRWIAPPGGDVHPRLALIKHGNRLFSYSDLVSHARTDEILPLPGGSGWSPQEWWDALLSRAPSVAHQAAALCQPRDFEVLDLYAMTPYGSA